MVAITRDQLVDMFDAMSEKSKWDLSKPLLWGYFFTDSSNEKLEIVAPLLEQQGYIIANIYMSDKDDPNEPDLWWLHVEKIEIHTVDSLHVRNGVLNAFADQHDLGSYDGMDVGPATPRH